MNLEYTFIAIMFPAIPLMMVMFGNRFHTVSVLIRKMHDDYIYNNSVPAEFDKQLSILKSRIILLKRAQIAMGLSFLFNMLSVFALFFNADRTILNPSTKNLPSASRPFFIDSLKFKKEKKELEDLDFRASDWE